MTKARDLANLISGGLTANEIPDLPASKITSGTIASARLSLSASDIPNLDTAKITSGTFADARLASSNVTQHVDLSSLNASNLTSGTVPSARLSLSASDVPDLATSKITSGTFADARLSSSSVTQHVDLSNLNASNLTSGSIPNARVPSGAVTQHVSAVTQAQGSWTPSPSSGSVSASGRYSRTGNIITCTATGYWTSRPAINTSVFSFSGLPVTSNSSGNSAGSGVASFHYMGQGNIFLRVVPNTTSIYFYNMGGQLSGSNTNTNYLRSVLNVTYDTGGYRIVNRNMEDSANSNNNLHFALFVTYQV